MEGFSPIIFPASFSPLVRRELNCSTLSGPLRGTSTLSYQPSQCVAPMYAGENRSSIAGSRTEIEFKMGCLKRQYWRCAQAVHSCDQVSMGLSGMAPNKAFTSAILARSTERPSALYFCMIRSSSRSNTAAEIISPSCSMR